MPSGRGGSQSDEATPQGDGVRLQGSNGVLRWLFSCASFRTLLHCDRRSGGGSPGLQSRGAADPFELLFQVPRTGRAGAQSKAAARFEGGRAEAREVRRLCDRAGKSGGERAGHAHSLDRRRRADAAGRGETRAHGGAKGCAETLGRERGALRRALGVCCAATGARAGWGECDRLLCGRAADGGGAATFAGSGPGDARAAAFRST